MPQEKSQKVEDFLVSQKDMIKLPLPSGLVVTFRSPPLAFHIGLNSVPGRVADAVVAARRGEISPAEVDRIEPDPDETERMAEVACVHCLVNPKFSLKPRSEEHTSE